MSLPIALTCGDPNGIGIDISFEAKKILKNRIPFFLIADIGHIKSRKNSQNFKEIQHPKECLNINENFLPVLHHKFPEIPTLEGAQPGNALATTEVIKRAVKMYNNKEVKAICTNPINKEVLKKGCQFKHPGHTEYLANLAGLDSSVMMLLCEELRVVPVTIHVALKDVTKSLTEELISNTVNVTHDALKRYFGIKKPRIAIAGLNPHAGENGTFGKEEIKLITPTIEKLRRQGLISLDRYPLILCFTKKLEKITMLLFVCIMIKH
jgi:4-hydroxythreonine-4-phosphate dehydrogenase